MMPALSRRFLSAVKLCLLFSFIGIALSSCFAPLNLSFERAKLLEKGQMEATFSASKYVGRAPADRDCTNVSDQVSGQIFMTNTNVALRFGYGISDKLNLKLKYEHLISDWEDYEGKDKHPQVSYVEVTPKFKIWGDYVSGMLPLGFYIPAAHLKGGRTLVAVQPRLLITALRHKNFEINTSLNLLALDALEDPALFVGWTLGFNTHPRKTDTWQVRPELGIQWSLNRGKTLPNGIANFPAYVSVGVALQYQGWCRKKEAPGPKN